MIYTSYIIAENLEQLVGIPEYTLLYFTCLLIQKKKKEPEIQELTKELGSDFICQVTPAHLHLWFKTQHIILVCTRHIFTCLQTYIYISAFPVCLIQYFVRSMPYLHLGTRSLSECATLHIYIHGLTVISMRHSVCGDSTWDTLIVITGLCFYRYDYFVAKAWGCVHGMREAHGIFQQLNSTFSWGAPDTTSVAPGDFRILRRHWLFSLLSWLINYYQLPRNGSSGGW